MLQVALANNFVISLKTAVTSDKRTFSLLHIFQPIKHQAPIDERKVRILPSDFMIEIKKNENFAKKLTSIGIVFDLFTFFLHF